VPEGRRLFPRLTVEDNLRMGAFLPAARPHFAQRLEMVYSLFPRMKERRLQMAGTMSGGEQQMLSIARAMMSNPKLLMLDEPSLGLAPVIIDSIMDKIREINEAGTTVLLIEQNAELALSISHYAYVLSVGEVVLSGDSESIAEDKAVLEAYLGGESEGRTD